MSTTAADRRRIFRHLNRFRRPVVVPPAAPRDACGWCGIVDAHLNADGDCPTCAEKTTVIDRRRVDPNDLPEKL